MCDKEKELKARSNELIARAVNSMNPHLAREERRKNGCPEGDLVCDHCGAKNASKNRQRTAYSNTDNMATLCPRCQWEEDEYWDDMWTNVPGYGG